MRRSATLGKGVIVPLCIAIVGSVICSISLHTSYRPTNFYDVDSEHLAHTNEAPPDYKNIFVLRRKEDKEEKEEKEKISATTTKVPDNQYRYNICNGLTNQLLYHAGAISIAAREGKEVLIPDYFIADGTQFSDDNVLPSEENSVPFSDVFDASHFLEALQTLGIQARFVSFDFTQEQIPCAGMGAVGQADDNMLLRVLKAFQPSKKLEKALRRIKKEVGGKNDAICVHHRDGEDWHKHCERWGNIPDGVYRGNCLGVPGRSFVESLEDRGLDHSKKIYYCGDHDPPESLQKSYTVLSWRTIMTEEDKMVLEQMNGRSQRDLYAFVDYHICGTLDHFIGNSVSTFSGLQIALREGEKAFWYNTQSIPLQDVTRIFQMPIVYTYTELSSESGKFLLKASILSARSHLPNNKIHMLYNGNKDKAFISWLTEQKVIIHQHNPDWKDDIEKMRKNGDAATSHLFSHPGNYFGTWQRIDIPNFVNSEYCLLLDIDTIILRPFTMSDFGLDITKGIAMSSEFAPDNTATNAGVMLMNIPYLRQTYPKFKEYILAHVDTARFDSPCPSDQGAYMDFYRNDIKFLGHAFNLKPYWKSGDWVQTDPYIIHFHGMKPADILSYVLGGECSGPLQTICELVPDSHYACLSLQNFGRYVEKGEYCKASFDTLGRVAICEEFFASLNEIESGCSDITPTVEGVLDKIHKHNKNIVLGRLQQK